MVRKSSSRTQSSKPIWAKRTGGGPSPRMLAYCAGRDVAGKPAADEALVPYDLWTNRAHCRMLARRGIIDAETHAAIAAALDRIESRRQAGKFRLDPRLEDVHINVERAVAAIAGEAAAGVMHTARSRNDQSATDVRMWLRDRLLARLEGLAAIIGALAAFARKHAATVAPASRTASRPCRPASATGPPRTPSAWRATPRPWPCSGRS